ncbi:hypothetical protein [Mycobacterium triplex]|uniref:hypothetical protein n=1 Tax=Mycobacterium triplex TaxID=47839 RepID=UPI00111C3422|nr:hypothetical protein [Mycobacterium triplex]
MDVDAAASVAIFVVIPWLLLNFPLVYRTVGYLQPHPLRVEPDGTRFCGIFRSWTLSSVTGRVLGSSTTTHTHGAVRYDAYSDRLSGGIRTDVRDTVRVQTADGNQSDVTLLNYNVSVQPGDVITVWYANKGEKWVTVAVLNHTTRQQNLNSGDLSRILAPKVGGYMVLIIVVNSLLSVFVCFLLPFWGILLGLFLWGLKRARRTFAQADIAPLWQLGEANARRLVA